ncbi:MAG: flavin-dependent monooxygenase [Rhodospirillales bacterium]|nr:flavin-dependent monooxygenase [Rhodospirillales bacterium]
MSADGGISVPNATDLIAAARAMIPPLAARAQKQAENRRLLPETVAELKEAGFFRVLQPRRWGGYEMDPIVFADIQMALAEGDMSVGWVYGVVGVHAFQIALFDDRAAQDVWGQDNSVLIASTYMPTGRAIPAPGGFRFSGKWKFSSGVEHCDWIFLGGLTVKDEATGKGGDYCTFLVPKSDFRIVDTWDVMGLKGTGSQDIAVDNVFIPDYRVHRTSDAYGGTSPGNAVNTGHLYRYPFVQVFFRAVTNGCIGGLQAMLNDFRAYGAARITTTGTSTANDPDAQLACAEAASAIDEMKYVLRRNFNEIDEAARRGELPTTEQRLLYRYQSSVVAERCLGLAAKLFKGAGGSGLYATQSFGRIYADLIAARQHVSNQSQISGRGYGAVLLGLPNHDPMI